MNKEKILGVVRHVLTFGAGWLVARGKLDASAVDTIVGAVVVIVGFAWSWFAPEKV